MLEDSRLKDPLCGCDSCVIYLVRSAKHAEGMLQAGYSAYTMDWLLRLQACNHVVVNISIPDILVRAMLREYMEEHWEAKRDVGMGFLVVSVYNLSFLHTAVPSHSLLIFGTAIPKHFSALVCVHLSCTKVH